MLLTNPVAAAYMNMDNATPKVKLATPIPSCCRFFPFSMN